MEGYAHSSRFPHLMSSMTGPCSFGHYDTYVHRESPRGSAGLLSARAERPPLSRCHSEPPRHLVTSFRIEDAHHCTFAQTSLSNGKEVHYRNAESSREAAPVSERRHYKVDHEALNRQDSRSERRHFHDASMPGSALSPRIAAPLLAFVDIDAPVGRQHFADAAQASQPWNRKCWDDAVGSSPSATRRCFFDQSYWADRYAELLGRPGLKPTKQLPAVEDKKPSTLKRRTEALAKDLDLNDVARKLSMTGALASLKDDIRTKGRVTNGKQRTTNKRRVDSAVASTAASSSGSRAASNLQSAVTSAAASVAVSAAASAGASGVATPELRVNSEDGLPNIAEEETPRPAEKIFDYHSTPLKLTGNLLEDEASSPESQESQESRVEPAKLPLAIRRVMHSVLSQQSAKRLLQQNGGADAIALHHALRELARSRA
eukprot:TRINITY_DN2474_c0_g2_i1.p1 TRINITY_DN2474_c0_g2~~TRINITY_DN2474_c0_g2_i1.p1  ORF type:complete len:431 (-),score=62.33 TRINITY_DN2474_c0_g2_i1:439-1731(-)